MSDARGANPGRSRVRVVAAAMAALVCVGALAVAGWWLASGGRWYVVRTPSMGTSAPVGTLLWVEPVDVHRLHVGEFVTFVPPGGHETFSHRIYAINADETITTKGQLTSPDPWRLAPKDIVGRVVLRWWGVGWLVRALPYLLVGSLLLWAVLRYLVRGRWRLPVGLVGAAIVLCVAVVVLRPFTGAELLGSGPVGNGGRATYVGTGLLPVRVSAAHGSHVDLRAGQVGTVASSRTSRPHHYPVRIAPHVSFWWWFWLVLVCFVPALVSTVSGRRPIAAPAPA